MSIVRASSDPSGGPGNKSSGYPVFSPDGTKIAFYSEASNLVAGDSVGSYDIFVKDLLSGTISRISTGMSGEVDIFGLGSYPVFSADGTKIAFASNASLVADDTNNRVDVYTKDLLTGVLERVSTDSSGAQLTYGGASPIYSPDGAKIAFTGQFGTVLYVKDLTSGFVTEVTDTGGASLILTPTFSPDGSQVAFVSLAANHVSGDTNSRADVFIKNLVTGVTTRVSTDALGGQANGQSLTPVFSPDGTRILFASDATNLVPGDTNNLRDLFIKDLVTGAISRVSTNTAGIQADDHVGRAVFSADGTKIVFTTAASNFLSGDNNYTFNIFIKDLTTGTVTIASTSELGEPAATHNEMPALSSDGTKIAFSSNATNLVAGDTGYASDIFVKSLIDGSAFTITPAGPPTKAEGLAGATPFTFTVTRAGDANTAQSVNWSVAGSGIAKAGASDFVGGALPKGTLSFAYGETAKTITIDVAGDALLEDNEGFAVTLSGSNGGAVLASQAAFVTILNDDAASLPVASISHVAMAEGYDDTKSLAFTVTLDRPATTATTISYATADGAALAGLDYISTSGVLTIAAGATAGIIAVRILGDTVYEYDESFSLTLFSPSGAILSGGEAALAAIATIRNDDGIVGTAGNDVLVGMDGDDPLEGSSGNDFLAGEGGNDTLNGGSGDDVLRGGSGADWLDGSLGIDYAVYDTSMAGVVVRLDLGTGSGVDAAGDTLTNIEGLIGSAFADTLIGNSGDNVLVGNDGADTLQGLGGADAMAGGNGDDVLLGNDGGDAMDGEAGQDFISGDSGNDTLLGGIGDDFLRGGSDGDWMDGGAGLDFVLYDTSAAGVAVRLDIGAGLGGDATGDLFTGIEGVVGSGFADALLGSDADNQLLGGDGDDVLAGLAGNDLLSGGAGSDLLLGDIGNDVLAGGAGADTLIGGAGADIFYFGVADNTVGVFDVITDFQDGEDLIYLQGWDPATLTAVDVDGNAVLATTDSGYMTGVVILGTTAAQVMDQVHLI